MPLGLLTQLYGYRRKVSEKLAPRGSTMALAVPQPFNPAAPAPEQVEVPDVTGGTVAAATTALEEAGLVLGVQTSEEHDTVPLDDIISQVPAAGELAEVGTAVDVLVSEGAPAGIPEILVGPELMFGTIQGGDAEWDINYSSGCFGSYWTCSNFVMGTQTGPGDNHHYTPVTALDAGKRYVASMAAFDIETNPGEGQALSRPDGGAEVGASLDFAPAAAGATFTVWGMVLDGANGTGPRVRIDWAGAATGSRIWAFSGLRELLSAHTAQEYLDKMLEMNAAGDNAAMHKFFTDWDAVAEDALCPDKSWRHGPQADPYLGWNYQGDAAWNDDGYGSYGWWLDSSSAQVTRCECNYNHWQDDDRDPDARDSYRLNVLCQRHPIDVGALGTGVELWINDVFIKDCPQEENTQHDYNHAGGPLLVSLRSKGAGGGDCFVANTWTQLV